MKGRKEGRTCSRNQGRERKECKSRGAVNARERRGGEGGVEQDEGDSGWKDMRAKMREAADDNNN